MPSPPSSIPICEALAAIVVEADTIAGTGTVDGTLLQSRNSRDEREPMQQSALFSVLRLAEKQCGSAAVKKWLASYLQQQNGGDMANTSQNVNSNTSFVASKGSAAGGGAPSSSRPSSRRTSPIRGSAATAANNNGSSSPKGGSSRSAENNTTATPAIVATSRTPSNAPPPRSVAALKQSGGSSSSGVAPAASIVASRRSNATAPPSAAAMGKEAITNQATKTLKSQTTTAASSPTGNSKAFPSTNSAGVGNVSRSSSASRTASVPRVQTPTNERPSVVANGATATRVGSARQAPSATSYRAPSHHPNYNNAQHQNNNTTMSVSSGGAQQQGLNTSRSASGDVPQRNIVASSGYGSTSTPVRSQSRVLSAAREGGSITAAQSGGGGGGGGSNPNTISGRRAAANRMRELWASHVSAAARTLGSLSIAQPVRVETLQGLQTVLEEGSDELVKHALNSEDFFCATCSKLMPLLNHQLQSVDPAIVRLVVSVVTLMVAAMGTLFAPILDTYFSRILWLLDCPSMTGLYEDIASHVAFLVEKIHHERMLCHLIDHIRWLERKGDPLPHSIAISKPLATAVHSTRDVFTCDRSRQMCMTLSFQLLELTVRRCCTKVQYSVDDLIHPNEYLLPYLDDLYCSDDQRAAGLPAFVNGVVSGGSFNGSNASLATTTRHGADVSCIIEIFRRSIARRENVDPKYVKVHKLPNYTDLADGEDLYDFGQHPLIKAFEFISQHTGKGLQEVTRDAVATTVGGGGGRGGIDSSVSPSGSPTRQLSPQHNSPNASFTGGLPPQHFANAAGAAAQGATTPQTSPQRFPAPPPPSLDTVARYNASSTNPINPLNTSASMFHINANTSNNVGGGGSHTTNTKSPSRTTEIVATTDALARTITNDDFRHKLGRQTVERMQFVTAVASRIWDTLILPIVGDTTRPSAALPYAYHIFEGFLALFPVHGALLFKRDVGLEQRRHVTRKLLDKSLRHMYNFPLFLRPILDDLSTEEIGGSLGDVNTITPMVDSPPTRLGQMTLRQARGGTTTIVAGPAGTTSIAASRRAGSAVSVGGMSQQPGAAASFMTMTERAASPNLFGMMGRVPNPENTSRIALRAPSPKVAGASVAPSRASSSRASASPMSAHHHGGQKDSAATDAFYRNSSSATTSSTNMAYSRSVSMTNSLPPGIHMSTIARMADPHNHNAVIKIKTPRAQQGGSVGSKAPAGPSPAPSKPAVPSAIAGTKVFSSGTARQTPGSVTIVDNMREGSGGASRLYVDPQV